MIGLEVKEARVFVRPGATDMRKQINGLALIVEPLDGTIRQAPDVLAHRGGPKSKDHNPSHGPPNRQKRAGAPGL